MRGGAASVAAITAPWELPFLETDPLALRATPL
jgi:hypothetical protein